MCCCIVCVLRNLILLAASQPLPNDPSHQYRLGVATNVPAFTDGKEHTVRVNYTTPVRELQVFQSFDDSRATA